MAVKSPGIAVAGRIDRPARGRALVKFPIPHQSIRQPLVRSTAKTRRHAGSGFDARQTGVIVLFNLIGGAGVGVDFDFINKALKKICITINVSP